MKFVYDDGGRKAAGYTGSTGDCVCRAIAIATGKPYQEVYDGLNELAARERPRGKRRRSHARTGVHKATSRRYLESLGWVWTPTMGIGTGCKVHLTDGELPKGRLIVAVSRHWTTVIDGVIHDTHDPQREAHCHKQDDGSELKAGAWRRPGIICWIERRCVYGYFQQAREIREAEAA